jgi:hypothetical protein
MVSPAYTASMPKGVFNGGRNAALQEYASPPPMRVRHLVIIRAYSQRFGATQSSCLWPLRVTTTFFVQPTGHDFPFFTKRALGRVRFAIVPP